MEPGLCGPDRDSKGCRHLGQRHPQEVVQCDHRAMVRVEATERPMDLLAVGERARRVGRGGGVQWAELDLERTSATTAHKVEAGVHDETPQPGVEPVRVAKPGQVPPGADQTFLDRVARELRVPDDETSCRVQPRKRRVDEPGEGVMIATPRAFDKGSLVHGLPL